MKEDSSRHEGRGPDLRRKTSEGVFEKKSLLVSLKQDQDEKIRGFKGEAECKYR
jgi:hypothetical protein